MLGGRIPSPPGGGLSALRLHLEVPAGAHVGGAADLSGEGASWLPPGMLPTLERSSGDGWVRASRDLLLTEPPPGENPMYIWAAGDILTDEVRVVFTQN